ncbi:hypothetical protein [uncultured Draconibacterium sp.]|uniref:hypothetical protein n=1 Tax=uncultured Draconibacterium sp. TaxID=1573823 RepID=UPI0025CF0EC3|nr:hypothetical protein [uncultured Draconibacterium sp.]
MREQETIEIKKIKNPFEKAILLFLKSNGKYIYGDIIKELKLPTAKGQESIYSLMQKGLIKHVDQSSYLKLNVDIK